MYLWDYVSNASMRQILSANGTLSQQAYIRLSLNKVNELWNEVQDQGQT